MADFKPVKGHPIQVNLANGIIVEKHICEWEMVPATTYYRCKIKFSNGARCEWMYHSISGWRLPQQHISQREVKENENT